MLLGMYALLPLVVLSRCSLAMMVTGGLVILTVKVSSLFWYLACGWTRQIRME